MRRLIWLAVVLGVLWCGWWMLAMFSMSRGVEAWFEGQRDTGLRAEYASTTRAGFPFALKTQLVGVIVANPQTGVGVSASHLDIQAAAHWPGDISVALPETPIQLINPEGPLTLQAEGGTLDLRLRPGLAMALESMSSNAGPWKLGGAGGTILSSKGWEMQMVQAGEAAESYRMEVSSDALTPGGVVRDALQLPSDWPLSFETFEATADITFDRPLDRHASDTTPQPRAITVQNALAVWGALRFAATADLSIDESGVPSGTATLRAQNWREVLALATATGAVPQGATGQIETIVGMLARLSGDPENIDLPFVFQDGKMVMGGINLGPAPKIVFP